MVFSESSHMDDRAGGMIYEMLQPSKQSSGMVAVVTWLPKPKERMGAEGQDRVAAEEGEIRRLEGVD